MAVLLTSPDGTPLVGLVRGLHRSARRGRGGGSAAASVRVAGGRPGRPDAVPRRCRRCSTPGSRRGGEATGSRASCPAWDDAAIDDPDGPLRPGPVTAFGRVHRASRRGGGPGGAGRDRLHPPRPCRTTWSSWRSGTTPRRTTPTSPGRASCGQRCSPFAADAVYVNYLGDARDEGEERVRAAYGAVTYDRLAALKRAVRPDQPLPRQPEHQAGVARTPQGAGRDEKPSPLQNRAVSQTSPEEGVRIAAACMADDVTQADGILPSR